MKLTTTTTLLGASFALAAVACGGAPLPASEMADSKAAVRAAEEAGAHEVPPAAAHLELANEQIDTAEKQIADGDHREAKFTLNRAAEDAELALDLARAVEAREAAKKAQDKIRELREEADAMSAR